MPSSRVFFAITIFYFILIILGAFFLGYFKRSGVPLDPNEWGDVLAGVFSPVAFLWLIFASMSQKYELSLQRSEFALQRNELSLQRIDAENANKLRAKDFSSRTTADYEPVFLIDYMGPPASGSPEGTSSVIDIRNVGAGVLDVVFEGILDISNGDAQYHDRDGGEIYYFPTGFQAVIHHSSREILVITYTRKDGVSKRNSYRLNSDRASMRLRDSEELALIN